MLYRYLREECLFNTFILTQYTIIAEWSQKIDSKSFTHMFSVISRKGDWSMDAQTAWSVLTDDKIPQVQVDTAGVSRAFLSSKLHSWSKAVKKNTRHQAIKDENGNLITQLSHSGSPLKEFSETAYREKIAGYVPRARYCRRWVVIFYLRS